MISLKQILFCLLKHNMVSDIFFQLLFRSEDYVRIEDIGRCEAIRSLTRCAEFNKKIHYLYMNSGTEGMDKMFGTEKLVNSLKDLGINAVYSESKGTSHEWLTWRRGLHEFIPHLFKK